MAGQFSFAIGRFVPAVVALVILPLAVNSWLSAVSERVGKPYLDEVFHVGQAQTYCDGRFLEWDPKITTPPGLYLLSYVVYRATGFCGLTALRILNAALLSSIFFVASYMSTPSRSRAFTSRPSILPAFSFADPQQIHTALNICLFPPLFFFCGLYYTDVGSTLFVLLFSKHFFDIHSQGMPSVFQSLCSILLGLMALMFRQTNIFWVAVFPIGLLLVGGISDNRKSSRDMITRTYSYSSQLQALLQKSWTDGVSYDPYVHGAWFDDYLLAMFSIVILAARILVGPARLLRLIRVVIPYVIVVCLFIAFVVWNGGVVLGDKSNHVATLHLPQMLYIWPYITFFSIPLTYPFIIQGALALVAIVPVVTIFEPLLIFSRHKFLPRPFIIFAIVGLLMLVVKSNTIIHPFTLADNRHYTFYVFRILMRHPAGKYLAVPVYLICAWSVIQALGAPAKYIFVNVDSTKTGKDQEDAEEVVKAPDLVPSVRLNNASSGIGCTVSFVLVWLATSTLALVTAPLVEPRYFIIPWIMWRLRVPQTYPGAQEYHPYQKLAADLKKENKLLKKTGSAIARGLWSEHDHRLWLETAWFLTINAVTGWTFLNKGFTWTQEPENVQRFMW